MSKWEVREVSHIGVKTHWQVQRDAEDGTLETAGGHYQSRQLAEILADTLNREEEKNVQMP